MGINFDYSLRHWDLVQLQGFRCFNPFDSRTLSEDLDWDPGVADDVAGEADSGDGTGAGRGCRDEEDEAEATGVLTGVGVVSVTDMVVTDDPAPEEELFGKVVEDEFKVGVELCF